jgi:hypothetical protein
MSLRRSLGQALAPDETMVFDAWGIRERFLGFGRAARALPPARNIYRAYEALFRESILPMTTAGAVVPTATENGLVRIFAGARMAHRRPPAALLHRAVQRVEAKGGRAEVMVLDGERPDLNGESLPLSVVPRDFGAMVDVMRGSHAVISPDSMTAHLAEYCNKPVLVLTPTEKFYWMPRFAAENGAIALFGDDLATGPLETLLTRYLAK